MVIILEQMKKTNFSFNVVVVITPSLPWDEGTARTAIQVYAINLIKIRLGERWQLVSNQS